MIRRNPVFGLTLVVVAALLFVQNAGASRVALRAGVDPASLTTLRVTGTVLVLVVAAVLFRRDALRPPSGRVALLIVVHGLVGVAALQWTYFVAIDRLPVGMALLLEYQAPLLVALWARFAQREHVRRQLWLGLGLAWGGLTLATGIWRGVSFDVVGVVAGLGAAVCFATYFLVGEHGVGLLDPLRVIVWSFLVAAVALNVVHPLTRVQHGVVGSSASLLGRLGDLSAPVWLLLLWIVVVGTVLPFGLELLALRHLSATVVTMVAMLEPIGVNALGWLWFSETLGPVELAGGLAVVAGIVLAQGARRPAVQVEPPHLG